MGISPRKSSAFRLSIALLSLSFIFIYLSSSHSSAITKLTPTVDYKTIIQTASNIGKGKKAVFVNSLLLDSNEIDGRFDNSTFAQLCKKKQWTEGLIFKCEGADGGIMNVRNVVLNCVRYAIEAGATQFIVPEILLQTSTSPTPKPVPFTHYFDLSHFTQTLSTVCPRITLLSHQNDLWEFPSTATSIPLHPTAITPTLVSGFILGAPGNWSTEFKNFLNTTHPAPFSAQKPVLVTLKAPKLQFPLDYDDPHFVGQFGRILRFSEDVRRVAAGVVWAMDQKYALKMAGTLGGVQKGRWFGAHLRTGADAAHAGWTSYAVQQGNYISHATKSDLDLIYLSSTSAPDTKTFTLFAASKNITVETTDSLLTELAAPAGTSFAEEYKPRKGFEQEWALLQGMNWDQKLLVDYEVLLRSSVFGGVWESSFSWGVAMRRHVVVSGEEGWTSIAQSAVVATPKKVPRKIEERNGNSTASAAEQAPSDEPQLVNPESPDVVNSAPEPEPQPEPEPAVPQYTADNPAMLSPAELVLIQKLEKNTKTGVGGKPASAQSMVTKLGDVAWEDDLSVVYGPVGKHGGGKGEGESSAGWRIRASSWP